MAHAAAWRVMRKTLRYRWCEDPEAVSPTVTIAGGFVVNNWQIEVNNLTQPGQAIRLPRAAPTAQSPPDQRVNCTRQRMPAGILFSGLGKCRRTQKVPLAGSIRRSTTATVALKEPGK